MDTDHNGDTMMEEGDKMDGEAMKYGEKVEGEAMEGSEG
jgi:hypothetical protein